MAGLIGIGGGLVYVFVLSEVFLLNEVPKESLPKVIIANSFFAIVFASFSSVISHFKNKEFYPKPIFTIFLGALIPSIIIQTLFVNKNKYDLKWFTVLFIILVFYLLLKTIFASNKNEGALDVSDIHYSKYLLTGALTGVVASLTGLGGGIVMMPILFSYYKLDYFKAKSISLGVIFCVAFTTTIINFFAESISVDGFLGLVHLPFGLVLAIAVFLSAPLGVKAAKKIGSKKVTLIYVIFLILFIVRKVWQLIM